MRKKLLMIMLCGVLLIGLTGCGNGKSDNDTINLTMDNYEDYLDIEVDYNVGGYSTQLPGYSFYFYDTIKGNVKVTGASTNYDYNNVEVEVKISGTYDLYQKTSQKYSRGTEKELDKTIIVKCNVGGSGEKSFSESLLGYTYMKSIDARYEIVNISGSIKKLR